MFMAGLEIDLLIGPGMCTALLWVRTSRRKQDNEQESDQLSGTKAQNQLQPSAPPSTAAPAAYPCMEERTARWRCVLTKPCVLTVKAVATQRSGWTFGIRVDPCQRARAARK